MSEKTKEVKAKAGTPSGKTEVTIGAAAKSVGKAVTELDKAVKAIATAASQAETITDEIATKQAELSALDAQLEEKKRKSEAELEIELLENKSKVVDGVLAQTGKVAVDKVEYEETIAACAKLKTDFNSEVSKEVAKANAIAKAGYEKDKQLDIANAAAANAQTVADLASTKAQVDIYKTQVAELIAQLSSERDARVKEAQARGNASVNITNTK